MKSPFDPDWQWHFDTEQTERRKAQPKPFVHRQLVSKCLTCQNKRSRSDYEYCLANGERIGETSGLGDCAYVGQPKADTE